MNTEVTVLRAKDGIWDLVVESCPFCHKRHLHGGGNGKLPVLGLRASHCNGHSYELVVSRTGDDGRWLNN